MTTPYKLLYAYPFQLTLLSFSSTIPFTSRDSGYIVLWRRVAQTIRGSRAVINTMPTRKKPSGCVSDMAVIKQVRIQVMEFERHAVARIEHSVKTSRAA